MHGSACTVMRNMFCSLPPLNLFHNGEQKRYRGYVTDILVDERSAGSVTAATGRSSPTWRPTRRTRRTWYRISTASRTRGRA